MKAIVSDELWAVVAPLLPTARPHRRGGWPRLPDRAVFTGIPFVLRTGIPWEWLPSEMGCGSGTTRLLLRPLSEIHLLARVPHRQHRIRLGSTR